MQTLFALLKTGTPYENNSHFVAKRRDRENVCLHELIRSCRLDGQTTVLLDLDRQSSSAKWGDHRDKDTPAVLSTHSERLPKTLQLAEENGAGFVVIDTAPHTESAALDAARAADLVIVPCKPDLVSIQAIGATIDLIHLAKQTHASSSMA